jgi:diguanylate cyclase (GGDEF)-like protein
MFTPDLIDAFAAGIYLLFAVVNLDLWLKRRDRASHLWLAAAAGGALMVDLTGMWLRRFPATSVGPAVLVNVLGVATVTISLFQLVLSLGNDRPGRVVRSVYAAMLALVLFIGVTKEARFIPVLLVTSLVLMLLAMVRAAMAGRAGDREARSVAGGLMVLLACLIADILQMTLGLPLPFGMPIVGFTALFLVSARALNGRYEREHTELVALQHQLEQRVLERTRELEDANQRLEEASRTDSLTGLPNRRAFLEVSDHELKRSIRALETFSIVMVDLDHFKEINDRHGHAAGDELLCAAASRLRSVLRAQDLVARWGGEEFILLFPDTDTNAATIAAEKVRAALASAEFERDGKRETITASFGIASHGYAQSLERTIALADAALYRAKAEGRNRVVAWP